MTKQSQFLINSTDPTRFTDLPSRTQRQTIHPWLLLLLLPLLLPIAALAQTPEAPQEVIFHVQFVQAEQAARSAIARERVTPAATNFENTGQISVHLLTDATDLQTLVNDQVGRGALDWIDGPQLRSHINREAIYVVGGRVHLPAVPDTSAPQTASTEDLRRTLPIH